MVDEHQIATERNDALRRAWRFVITHGAGIAVIIAGLWTAGTWLYIQHQQASDAAAAETSRREQATQIAIRESQKPFLERQLAFYFEAAKVTAKLATSTPAKSSANQDQPPPEDWDWARRRFWELYWGELAAVESPEVARAMVQFGNGLNELEKCIDKGGSCDETQNALKGPSIQLAHQIRESIEKGWGYSLPSLQK
ncbi:hypothetical protein IVB18_04280 [Bradyrhizobium sp. 186]|uniref:hypothetical protein n=1 Tax=Bradyrhizobium sp. 186 TaxID=2782654 RepID=UPI0020006651|nr:hypothetical protein [Bradyrhizobium sp. 186]UPK36607.1 hypothetical protein IVB18_04280 [Bradyrhizobium sp. 186]